MGSCGPVRPDDPSPLQCQAIAAMHCRYNIALKLLQCRAMARPRCKCKHSIVYDFLWFFPLSRSRSRDTTTETIRRAARSIPDGSSSWSRACPRFVALRRKQPTRFVALRRTLLKIIAKKNNGPFSRKTQQVFCRKKCKHVSELGRIENICSVLVCTTTWNILDAVK